MLRAPPKAAPMWQGAPTMARRAPRRGRPPSSEDALALAGHLYAACTKGSAPLDRTVARFLREHRALADETRGVVVRTAQGMLRNRRWLDEAAAALSFRPTREALVSLYLVGREGKDPKALGLDDKAGKTLRYAARRADEAGLGVRASLPDWLASALTDELGPDEGERLALALSTAPPTTLRANTLKTTREELATALAREGFATRPTTLSPLGLVVEEPGSLFRSEAFRAGAFEMQDEASQLAALLVGARPGALVVDGCAGAGGKTLALAAAMENKGRLYAFDVAAFRLDDLRKRARRAGVHNLRVHTLTSLSDGALRRLAGKADAVLLDAPCSGTGVLRRNPDTSWRLSPEDVTRMQAQQADILDAYAPLVRPGGALVYATCSVLHDEDERQVEAFLARTPGFTLVDANQALRAQGITLDDAGPYLRLYPHRHGTDGFFAARLVREG